MNEFEINKRASSEEVLGSGISWHVVVLALFALLALFARFLQPSFYGLFEDDFFYYALVAKHLVVSHISSFDGTHLTNGYHPLWFVTVALCFWIFPGTGFFIAIQAVALAAILVFYFGILRCLARFGVPAPLCRLTALVLSMHALLLFRYGMEVTLALPFAVWTLAYILAPDFRWSPRQTFLYGLLAALTVLSRLDAILLAALLMAAQTLTAGVPWGERIRRIGLYCAGWFPLLAYLGINLHFFHALLPVSGSAKQLKPLWPPSAIPLRSLVFPPDRTKDAFVYPALLVIALGLIAFGFALRRRPLATRTALLAALFLFPFVHVGLLCLLSDWTVWPWYYYSLCFALLAAAVSLLTLQGEGVKAARALPPALGSALRPALGAIVLALGTYVTAYAFLKHPARKALFFVGEFARQHPGIYAMGDGSGTPAYLAEQPFIQLEGLVMDADYLKLVRQRTPLHDVLGAYHVDYYVTFARGGAGPCRLAIEPTQAGPDSPRMIGRICAEPLAFVKEQDLEIDIYRAADVLPQMP